ncbi:CBS domain-containing protein [Hyphomicrobium facile]|uniref:BON domain-containing protein n=1 Tax=Hyphomicrobium facile TaxID=51670 RepID=A0A1I7NI16_9HYPH|nr:CBS domain-containing protein [Hyphomicrobium facile]SFV34186.1 BON domain-containing protein [Hyphomicrobium facile]
MKARDIMTKNVVSVTPECSIVDMAATMQKFRVSGLPVINAGGALVGLVTEGDCLRRAETGTEAKRSGWRSFLAAPATLAGEYIRSHGRKVADVMTPDPITIGEDTDLDEIIHLMEKHQIKRLPVVTDDAVVGIVSRANIVQALAGLARGSGPVREDDTAIRDQVRAELRKLPWMAIEFITPTVKDGIVDLWGSFTAYQQDRAAVVAAENVPGVKEVRNHLAWVDPVSGLVVYSPDDKEQSQPAEPVS